MEATKSEAYIKKIIEITGLKEADIKKLVEEKREELKGLISEAGALFIIAKELGADIESNISEKFQELEISISEIRENMKNLTLTGRIRFVYDVHRFTKKDGGEGIVGSFLLADETGEIRVVLWDEHTKIIEDPDFIKNNIIKIINVYAKLSRSGVNEVHTGRFARIIISPDDVDNTKYPVSKENVEISSVDLSRRSVTLEGKINSKYPIREFSRNDGSTGKVASLTLRDSTGIIKITFWDDNTQKIEGYEMGDIISITDLTPKISSLDNNDSIELQGTSNSTLKKLDKEIKLEAEFAENIKSLETTKNSLVSIRGVIASKDSLREVTSKSGTPISLLSFSVSDESSIIEVTAWSEKAEELAEKLSTGQVIILKNGQLKSFRERKQITLITDSIIEKVNEK